ncbi:hypothetical protein GYA27_04215 [candidate division WWE3 bacterium]|uniref:Uncharacterized protein n=1 Tax=candidate division WWE3 bacterium TaxID=2053526 RepID=A0A7X9DLE8_UNCKA|nr:hypothetical protein [candidate division WWE3 bacterium]
MPKRNSFTSVTTLSKIVALALFVSLPFIGFYYGYNYSQTLCKIKYQGLVSKPKDNSVKMNTYSRNKQDTVLQPKNKEYTFEFAGTEKIKGFSIKILPEWSVSQEQTVFREEVTENKIKVTRDNHSIIIQNGFTGAKCAFPDTQIKSKGDIEHYDFVDFFDAGGNSYRRAIPLNSILASRETIRYNVCQYFEEDENRQIAGYYFPTKNFELISIETPKEQQVEIMSQIDTMLSSLKQKTD